MRASWMRSISRWAAGDSGVRARNSAQGCAGSRTTSRSSPNVCLLKNTPGLSPAKSSWSRHCAVSELVACCVTADVVVIVEEQNARVVACLLALDDTRSEQTYTLAHHAAVA